MGTKSMNAKTESLIDNIYRLIEKERYEEAEAQVHELEKITDSAQKDVICANMLIKRGSCHNLYQKRKSRGTRNRE